MAPQPTIIRQYQVHGWDVNYSGTHVTLWRSTECNSNVRKKVKHTLRRRFHNPHVTFVGHRLKIATGIPVATSTREQRQDREERIRNYARDLEAAYSQAVRMAKEASPTRRANEMIIRRRPDPYTRSRRRGLTVTS